MTEIPIEKKGGAGKWLWLLLAAIIILLLLWLFLGNDRDDRAVEQQPTTATAPADTMTGAGAGAMAGGAAGAAITDLATITGTSDGSLSGREVRLTNAQVGEMAGDASFWLTGDNGQRAYVVLNEQRDPSNNVEGRVNVNAGDRVDVVGTIRNASDSIPENTAMGNDTAQPLPNGINHYIYAERATKSQ